MTQLVAFSAGATTTRRVAAEDPVLLLQIVDDLELSAIDSNRLVLLSTRVQTYPMSRHP
jgi:hypothetical protein